MKGNEEVVDAGERQLRRVEEEEAVVTMYCISKKSIFNKNNRNLSINMVHLPNIIFSFYAFTIIIASDKNLIKYIFSL